MFVLPYEPLNRLGPRTMAGDASFWIDFVAEKAIRSTVVNFDVEKQTARYVGFSYKRL